jgi:hypothetical protein
MSKRWAFMERFEVPHFDNPDVNYLERLRIVATPWFAVYLHRLGTPDSRPTLHDHPWSFVSIILRGGYVEHRLNLHARTVERKHRRHINIMRRDDAHSIESLDRTPTWTLLFVGRRRREWGYWRPIVGSSRGAWSWTPFDRDVHADEFDRVLAERGNR